MTEITERARAIAEEAFDAWITELEENVIEGEYGFEPGEFTVYPEHWRPMWLEGLTPQDAYRRALDAFAEARKEEEDRRLKNWQRIQDEDAAYKAGRAAERGADHG